jgi:hypothetical protein
MKIEKGPQPYPRSRSVPIKIYSLPISQQFELLKNLASASIQYGIRDRRSQVQTPANELLDLL